MARVQGRNGGNDPTGPDGDDPHDVSLAPDAQSRIGAGLQAMYSELLRQPIPDKLLALIAQLDRKDSPPGGGNEG
jgi:hypothetical protein